MGTAPKGQRPGKRTVILLFCFAAWAGALRLAETPLEARNRDERPMPPVEAASVAFLGGLKAAAVDVLWVRADLAHREGRFYELWPTLALMEALQPRNARAAEYIAWQMAYAFSLAEPGPERAWPWIERALDRLAALEERRPGLGAAPLLRGRILLEKCDPRDHPHFAEQARLRTGLHPAAAAARAFEKARRLSPGEARPAVFAVAAYLRLLEEAPDPAAEARLEAALEALRRDHPGTYRDLRSLGGVRDGTSQHKE